MGLDIYLRKTSHKTDVESVAEIDLLQAYDKRDAIVRFSVKFANSIKRLSYDKAKLDLGAFPEEEYRKAYVECLDDLATECDYPGFDLGKIGYSHDGNHEIKPLETWIENASRIIDFHTTKDLGYFRKVNLLFAYFQDKRIMIDDYYAEVTKETALDIIDRCEKVLADHKKAEKLLPTRTGFFFGSTDYDQYYFEDVERVLKVFKENVLPVFDERVYEDPELLDTYKCYIIFSW